MNFKLALMILILAAGDSAMAAGVQYHVNKSGHDSYSCSQARSPSTPKQTITAGLSCLASGDTLNIGPGTYGESISYNNLLVSQSGTSWNSATIIQGDPANRPILRGIGLNSPGTGLSRAYIIFRNLVLDGGGAYFGGGRNGGDVHHIKLENSEVRNVRSYAIGLGGADASGHHLWLSRVITHGVPTHCWYIEGDDNLIEDSECYDAGGYGVHNFSYLPAAPSRNVYRRNYIHGTGYGYFSSANEWHYTSFAILLTAGDNNIAYNNIIVNNANAVSVHGRNNQIYNNVLYKNGNGSVSCSLKGDYCYPAVDLSRSTGAVVKNNIVFGNAINSIYKTDATGPVISSNLLGDPSFVDAAKNDFHLQPSSAAINKAETIAAFNDDYDGALRDSSWDIGAFEYGGSNENPPQSDTQPPSVTIISPANGSFASRGR